MDALAIVYSLPTLEKMSMVETHELGSTVSDTSGSSIFDDDIPDGIMGVFERYSDDDEREMFTAGLLEAHSSATQKTSLFDCGWRINEPKRTSGSRIDRTVDLYLRTATSSLPHTETSIDLTKHLLHKSSISYRGFGKEDGPVEGLEGLANRKTIEFLHKCFEKLVEDPHRQVVALKLILPAVHGFLTRSDFLERRMEGCELVESVQDFLEPRQEVVPPAIPKHGKLSFLDMISCAAGGILARDMPDRSLTRTMSVMEEELTDRLSFPWLVKNPIPSKRLALLEGRRNYDMSKRLYESAKALGITIVVVEVKGHWLEDPTGPYAHLREGFISISPQVDSGLPDRIVEAIRSYGKPFDGLITINDPHLSSVARAAEILGLPTSPAASFALSADKGKTRALETSGDEILRVSNPEDLRSKLGRAQQLQYPLIVKPCQGWSSDCVTKVTNEAQLISAVNKASSRHAKSAYSPSHDVIIEPYIDGPEVDANFILWDGEILFFEISDGFPCTADRGSENPGANFMEEQMVFASGLPDNEVQKVRETVHASILRQGFRSGVFHCEARVRNSSMTYSRVSECEDLVLRDDAPVGVPSSFLIEINARPSGYFGNAATELTHGVSLYTQQMLFAIGDEQRFRALASGFMYGPQWTCNLVMITSERTGVLKTVDTIESLQERRPDLMRNVAEGRIAFGVGETVPGPEASELLWFASFLVCSRESRREALMMGEELRREFSYTFED